MKKIIGALFISLIMITTFSFAAYPADLENEELEQLATEPETESEVIADQISGEPREETDIISDDVYQVGEEVTLEDTIDGNVYVMGKDVNLKNTVIYGNAYVMGQKVNIENVEIGGSLYVMGQKIDFSGMTSDIYVLGQEVNFGTDTYVWRSVKAGGDKLNINGNIGRNVNAAVSNLTVGDNAVIEGDLNYVSEKEGSISDSAQIANINYTVEEIADEMEDEVETNGALHYVYEILKVAFKTLIVALIIVFCVNKFTKLKRTDNIATDLLKDFGKGAGVLFLTPIIAILLMVSVIGLGFGFSLLALYIIAIYIATSLASIEIANRILTKMNKEINKGKIIGISILVSLVIWLVGLIPGIGGLVEFILLLIGLGIVFDIIFQKKEKVDEN